MSTNSTRRSLSERVTAMKRDDRYKQFTESAKGAQPINPFKSLRINGIFELSGINVLGFPTIESELTGDPNYQTLQEVADRCGVTKQTLIRTEQGLFAEPPIKIVEWFADTYDLSELELIKGYENFQLAMRARYKRLFDLERALETRPVKRHPLRHLLDFWLVDGKYETMNPTELAKLLCLSQPLLNHWIKTGPKQAKVPKPLIDALIQSGYSRAEVGQFVEDYAKYRGEFK